MGWSATGRVLVAGLGNPGPRYEQTRHNIGFMLADALARAAGLAFGREKFQAHMASGDAFGRACVLLKPQTFMNRSGQSVARAASFFSVPADHIVVLHDELDLPFGVVRVKTGGGHGGHNGLRSIVDDLGARDFVRVRLGIGRPPHGSPTDWVLGRFGPSDLAELDDVLAVGARALRLIFEQDPKAAMNEVNGLKSVSRQEET